MGRSETSLPPSNWEQLATCLLLQIFHHYFKHWKLVLKFSHSYIPPCYWNYHHLQWAKSYTWFIVSLNVYPRLTPYIESNRSVCQPSLSFRWKGFSCMKLSTHGINFFPIDLWAITVMWQGKHASVLSSERNVYMYYFLF